jgi:hypothetical protein
VTKGNLETKTSKYKGVSFHASTGKWVVRASVGGKCAHWGYFEDEAEAANEYDLHARMRGDAESSLNFPMDRTKEFVRAKPLRKKRSNATSIYRGVHYEEEANKFSATFEEGGSVVHIGKFKDEIEAAKAYDAYVLLHGLNKPLNFHQD